MLCSTVNDSDWTTTQAVQSANTWLALSIYDAHYKRCGLGTETANYLDTVGRHPIDHSHDLPLFLFPWSLYSLSLSHSFLYPQFRLPQKNWPLFYNIPTLNENITIFYESKILFRKFCIIIHNFSEMIVYIFFINFYFWFLIFFFNMNLSFFFFNMNLSFFLKMSASLFKS